MAKYDGQLFDILNCSLPYCEDRVFQPIHTDRMESLIEELLAKLLSEDRELLHDTKLDSPVLVLGQISQAWDDGLLQVLQANHFIQILHALEQVEADL